MEKVLIAMAFRLHLIALWMFLSRHDAHFHCSRLGSDRWMTAYIQIVPFPVGFSERLQVLVLSPKYFALSMQHVFVFALIFLQLFSTQH